MFHTLIASDLDGTLLPEGNPTLDPRLFDLIRRLRKKGVAFCAASGRSYGSLREIFAPVLEDIFCLSENSAEIHEGTKLLEKICIPDDLSRRIVASIAPRTDCFARVNTNVAHYYVVPDEETAASMRTMEYPDAIAAFSFDDVQGEVTQITACSKGDIRIPAADLIPMWNNQISVAITGEHWLDFTTAGKGVGLRHLCQHLGIGLSETYAFGDNFNDVSMLEITGHPYIMSTADDVLLARFPMHSDNAIDTLLALENRL